jgi:hypothetical protein
MARFERGAEGHAGGKRKKFEIAAAVIRGVISLCPRLHSTCCTASVLSRPLFSPLARVCDLRNASNTAWGGAMWSWWPATAMRPLRLDPVKRPALPSTKWRLGAPCTWPSPRFVHHHHHYSYAHTGRRSKWAREAPVCKPVHGLTSRIRQASPLPVWLASATSNHLCLALDHCVHVLDGSGSEVIATIELGPCRAPRRKSLGVASYP